MKNENAENLESFTDIRDMQKQLKANGIKMLTGQSKQQRDQRILSLKIQTGIRFLSINFDEKRGNNGPKVLIP